MQTTLVTVEYCNGTLKQFMNRDDGLANYEAFKELVADGTIKTFSLVTLAVRPMADDVR